MIGVSRLQSLQCLLLGLVMRLVGDVMYVIIDPRIDFEARGV